jgi:hypothetical protein
MIPTKNEPYKQISRNSEKQPANVPTIIMMSNPSLLVSRSGRRARRRRTGPPNSAKARRKRVGHTPASSLLLFLFSPLSSLLSS